MGLQAGTGPGLRGHLLPCPRLGCAAGAPARCGLLQSHSPPASERAPCSQPARLGAPGACSSWAGRVQVGPHGCNPALGAAKPRRRRSPALPLRSPLSDHAVLAVCKAVYYQHVNNLSRCLITWKGSGSCGGSLKSMPVPLALGRAFSLFVFHSRKKCGTAAPASKGNTYL